jgi:hypothetical protein
MPSRIRIIDEKIKQIVSRKAQFENELKEAGLELERLQIAIVKGTADSDSLVAPTIKVNTIEQTIKAFDLQLAALDADLIAQKKLETKKEIFLKIKVLDDDAERAGKRLIELFPDIENLSYSRCVEMFSLRATIADLKFEFGSHIFALLPDVNKLKSRDLPELQSELDAVIAELENTCKLAVLRSDVGLSDRSYATDDQHAFRLPDNDLGSLVWLLIRTFGEREQEKARLSIPEKKTSFFRQMFN